ncbi:MAG: DUF6448 family protein [Halodesulfurarchaeum sp.]
MPPHCDTKDGPVVEAAREALETENVNYILPYVGPEQEAELEEAFEDTLAARKQGEKAQDVADQWFFETAVRLHRENEGEEFTGLRPAGLDRGPVVPRAETAIEEDDPSELIDFIQEQVRDEIEERFERVKENEGFDINDVEAAREYVSAKLDLTLYSHHLYQEIPDVEGYSGST